MSDYLQPHELQQARLPCPSLSPGLCSNSCPLSQGCHPTISPTVIPFSSGFQPSPTSGSFPMSHLFISGCQHIGTSASASVLSVTIEVCLTKTTQCFFYYVSWIQSLSRVRLFVTPWITAHQASLSITNSGSSLKIMSIKSVMPSSHLILCCPLLLLPPIPLSIKGFSNESALCIRWPKYWSFSFNISPSSEHSGLTSFRIDWLVQGILKSSPAPQFKSISSALSFPYSLTLTSIHDYWKTIALTRWTFVGKVMSLLFVRCLGWS